MDMDPASNSDLASMESEVEEPLDPPATPSVQHTIPVGESEGSGSTRGRGKEIGRMSTGRGSTGEGTAESRVDGTCGTRKR